MKEITERDLDLLREKIFGAMSPKRFRHTVAVEQMAERLCRLYCPDQIPNMRAAALLHDLTKELSGEEQIRLCQKYGLNVSDADRLSPKTFHARTAAAMISDVYSELANDTVVNAVRWHTTGRADMTLTEKLLYLADYIDHSRTFPNCVLLRRFFWGAEPEKLDTDGRNALLRDTLILSFDMTIKDLLSEGAPIAEETFLARNALLLEKARG